MVEPTKFNEENQPELLKKFTDAPKALIELVVRILEKLGLNVSGRVKNEFGIILLLVTIYATGGLFKLSITTPMMIFTLIVGYTILDFWSDNVQIINRFLRGITNPDNIIKKVKEGTLANASEEISLSTFDAEGLDKLLIEISKADLLTYDIQNAAVNTQTLYPKNLRTVFNKDNNINIHEDFVLKILSFNYIKQKLTNGQIQHIVTKFINNHKIIVTLLFNQPQSFEIVESTNDENIRKILVNFQKYSEKPFFLDKHFDSINTALKSVLIGIVLILMVIFIQFSTSIRMQSSEQFLAIFIVFIGVSTVFLVNIIPNLKKRLRKYIFNKKVNYVLNSDFSQ